MEKNLTNVLVVEDDATILSMIGTYLAKDGFFPLLCDNGRKAKDIFLHNPPHIIVLDIGLPEVDGLALTRFFRTKSQAPIVIISARPTEEDRLSALELGADDYLVKPFSVRELVMRLKNIERRLLSVAPPSAHGSRPAIHIGQIAIQPTTLSLDTPDASIKCTKSEFELLYFLAKHQ